MRHASRNALRGIVQLGYRLLDVAVLAGSAALAFLLHLSDADVDAEQYVLVVGVALLIAMYLGEVSGIYSARSFRDRMSRLRGVLLVWLGVGALLLLLAFATKAGAAFSRAWGLTWFALAAGGLIAGRILLDAVFARQEAAGAFARTYVVLGAGPEGARLVQRLANARAAELRFLGAFDDRAERPDPALRGRVLGTFDDAVPFVREREVDAVFIALPWSAEQRIMEVLHRLRELAAEVLLCPDGVAHRFAGNTYESVGGVPMLTVMRRPIDGLSWFLKEAEDKLIAGVALLLLSPVLLLVALAVKLDSRGPVFFRQPRYGFNNRLFEVFKFRTMRADQTDLAASKLATRDDPRLTRIGGFLRRTSLDELPQLFNVLRGDMSLVGPRPHAVAAKAGGRLYQDVVEDYAVRHRVKPGITGWAQVNGWRGETDTPEKILARVEHDLYYIENWSLLFDLRILAMTLVVVLSGRNAY